MQSTQPPLTALRAFEAAARHLSMTRAADELSVTQPAVTQQIRALEKFLGHRLVFRQGQGLALTPAGKRYAERLATAFSEIGAATEDLLHDGREGGAVTLSLLPTLAQRWLIPRLGSFQAAHPDIEVRFSTTARIVDLGREDIDLAIRFGKGTWAGCDSRFMMANDMFPVLSPQLQAERTIRTPEDLSAHVWLRVEREPRDQDWRDWLQAAGVPGLKSRGGIAFETSSQALAAAAAGLGVAIGHRPFVMDDLASKRLVMPLDTAVPSAQAYYVVTPKGSPLSARAGALRDWLLEEARYGAA